MRSKSLLLITFGLLQYSLIAQVHSVGIQGGLSNWEYRPSLNDQVYISSIIFPNLVYKLKNEIERGKTFSISYQYLFKSRVYTKINIEYIERRSSRRIDYWSSTYDYPSSYPVREPFVFSGLNDTGYKSNWEGHYLSVPLIVGYSFPFKKWNFIPQVGFRISKIKYSKTSSDPQPRIIDIREISCDVESSNQVYYYEGNCYEYLIGIEPSYNYSNKISRTDRYKEYDLLMGIEVKYYYSDRLAFNFNVLKNRSITDSTGDIDLDGKNKYYSSSFLAGISYQINKAKSD
jgi:hypothetical protein